MGMHTSEAKQKLRGLGFNPKSRTNKPTSPFPMSSSMLMMREKRAFYTVATF
jgi:hypothetical protein